MYAFIENNGCLGRRPAPGGNYHRKGWICMTQAAFLEELDRHLTGLSDEERRRAADFYRELILDGMEDGKTEEEAVEALGSPEAAAAAYFRSSRRRTSFRSWMRKSASFPAAA